MALIVRVQPPRARELGKHGTGVPQETPKLSCPGYYTRTPAPARLSFWSEGQIQLVMQKTRLFEQNKRDG